MMNLLKVVLCSIVVFLCGCEETTPPIIDNNTSDSLKISETILTNGEQPSISPDGKRIAFNYKGDIFIMDTSAYTIETWDGTKHVYDTLGGEVTRVTYGIENDVLPRWDVTGKKIGFIRVSSSDNMNGEFYFFDIEKRELTKIQTEEKFNYSIVQKNEYISGGNYGVPMWDISWDGKYLAFLTQDVDSSYINIISIPTGSLLYRDNVFRNNDDDYPCFSWSQNADHIVYLKQVRDSNATKKTQAILYDLTQSSIKKDQQYLYGKYISRIGSTGKYHYMADGLPDNNNIVITDFSTTIEYLRLPFSHSQKYSPDGNMIIYHSTGQVYGPYGYRFSQIGLYHVKNKKDYIIVNYGDAERTNYYYEWGLSSDEIYFEKYRKIMKIKITNPW